MKQKSLLGAVAFCLAFLGVEHVAPARDRELRTGLGDSFVIFYNGDNGDAGGSAWLSLEPPAMTEVPLLRSRWILDAVLDDAQRLWVALGPIPRKEAIVVMRFSGPKLAATKTFSVAGTTAVGDARLLLQGGAVYLASPAGLFSVEESGARRLFSWQPDNYGFYAASLAKSKDGWLMLAPVFNTCGSSDLLESLWLFEAGAKGQVERRGIGLPDGPLGRAWLGADGVRYGIGCDGDVGLIGRHKDGRSWPIFHREPAPSCRYHLEQNGRFTIVQFARSLVRIHEGRAERLITDKNAAEIEAFYPDSRGRALVLHKDGTLVRYSSQAPPVLVGKAR